MNTTVPSSPSPLGAFLVRSLPPGGMERVLLRHAQAARDCGFHPVVICLETPGAFQPQFEKAGISTQCLYLPSSPVLSTAMGIPRLISWLRKNQPRFLQVHMRRAGTLGRFAARITGTPSLVALHNCDPPAPLWLRPIERWLDSSSHFLAVSESVREHACRQRQLSKSDTTYVPNALPAPTFQRNPAPSERHKTRRIGFLGKLEPKKNPELFLALAQRARQDRRNLSFHLAGTGPSADRLFKTYASAPVEFLGQIPSGPDFLKGLSVACFPSRHEGFGLAVGEALSVGTPVLLSDIPPFREVYGSLPSECFLSDAEPLARWLDRVERLSADTTLRKRVFDAGAQILTKFSEESLKPGLHRFYSDLL